MRKAGHGVFITHGSIEKMPLQFAFIHVCDPCSEKEGPDKGQTKYLIRPGPDPKRKEETSWLTRERIEEEAIMPSYNWTNIGSGNLGKVFVEILGCNNLPNMDTSRTLGDKTDCSVSLVYEDCFAKTDTIDDCLSPRWMPWTHRAFIFNMNHTSSQLFLGVLDTDAHSSHDLIGRISVDMSNFQPNSIYLLEYNLYKSAKCGPREPNGTIKIRLRLELEDERTLLLSNFQLPLTVDINVDKKKDFKVIKQTVEGGVNMNRNNPSSVYRYYDELWTYLFVIFIIQEAFLGVIFWRGYSTVSLPMPSHAFRSVKWVDLRFPLHSLVAFISITTVIDYPNLLPSFCLGCIGWLLLAMQERRTNNPSLWLQCKSFSHFLSALIGINFDARPHEATNSGHGGYITWDDRVKQAEMRAKKDVNEHVEKCLKLYDESEGNDVYKDDARLIGTSQDFLINTSLKVLFGTLQQWLSFACTWLRISKNILCWEECYISFWITFCSLLLAVLFIFVPWGLVLHRTLRVFVWVAFGPWMKLVDVFYYSHATAETNEQKLIREKRQNLDAQVAREKDAKLMDIKMWMFGEHTCRVNVLKMDRYYDLPLPKSSVTSYTPKLKSLGEVAMQEAGYRRDRIDGQQLVGEMIPQIYKAPPTEAPTGRPTKKTDLLEKGSPGACYDGNDSYVSAATKVGSILISAGAITWLVVPLFVHIVRLVLPE